jgi:hypothetical protein
MTTTTLHGLYRGALNVWVEDPMTHDVLTYLWRDPEINVLVTQGKPGVQLMVRSNPSPYTVYGVVDRDFDDDNEAEWERSECSVLRLPAHELENLLLDFEILASLSKGETAAGIRARAHARATELLWWMVCKAVLRELQEDLGRGFPGDPPSDLRSAGDVERYVGASPYWAEHAGALDRWRASSLLHERVQERQHHFEQQLAGEGWTQSFSGKEILRHLRSTVPGLDEAPPRPPKPSQAERDLNLGKRIARQMREKARIPSKLLELRRVLRKKAGL